MYKFGSIIKKIRKDRHLTQKMLAENVCSQSVLSRIENNEEVPNVVVMQQLCHKLDISIDQVMNQDSKTIKTNSRWLHLMDYYYLSKDFKQLKQLIDQESVEKSLFSDEDYQKYYYYLGSAIYMLDGNLKQSLELVQKSLNITYTNKKKIVSDMEILLLSELGKVYFEMEDYEVGDFFLKKSIALFYTIPSERHQIELTKIFYNAAVACLNVDKYELALEMINQGINWSRKNNSYYFLDELLLLKGIVYEDNDQLAEAVKLVEMANIIKIIASNDEL